MADFEEDEIARRNYYGQLRRPFNVTRTVPGIRYYGEAIAYLLNNGYFGTLDDGTNVIDLFPYAKQGYMLRKTLINLLHLYFGINNLLEFRDIVDSSWNNRLGIPSPYSEDALLDIDYLNTVNPYIKIKSDRIMMEAFGSSIPAVIYKLNDLMIKEFEKGAIPKLFNTYELLTRKYPHLFVDGSVNKFGFDPNNMTPGRHLLPIIYSNEYDAQQLYNFSYENREFLDVYNALQDPIVRSNMVSENDKSKEMIEKYRKGEIKKVSTLTSKSARKR